MGGILHGGRMPSLVHQGGWVKREAEATYGAGEGADDNASATRGTARDVGAVRGGVSAARGMDGTSGPCVVQAEVPGPCMEPRQSLKYLQQKRSRVE
jgi:hypothetical protein